MRNEYCVFSATTGAYCGGLGISADEYSFEDALAVAITDGYDLEDDYYIDIRDTF